MNNTYGKIASLVYNLDKYIWKSFGDVEYYRERLSGCLGPILEPAVGNGRALIPLLEAGLDVNGFDASQDRKKSHAPAKGGRGSAVSGSARRNSTGRAACR
ncbi:MULTISPECIES: hypothetical protein [unclassified Ensifer]|uniref:hypothetical protein n=1 Tax=unclassified Ensifer TaxID=2633371 RepID=UPI000B248707|nr:MULTISPECIES: hypothetical protein [unclassified Ensifer]